uniref:Uncharacterized protein n=1 Tax=Rhizophora mucronata TaxID=61149 RepID=A0A2P2N2B7_RHIMU
MPVHKIRKASKLSRTSTKLYNKHKERNRLCSVYIGKIYSDR